MTRTTSRSCDSLLATLHDVQVASYLRTTRTTGSAPAGTPCTSLGCRGTRHTPRRHTRCRRPPTSANCSLAHRVHRCVSCVHSAQFGSVVHATHLPAIGDVPFFHLTHAIQLHSLQLSSHETHRPPLGQRIPAVHAAAVGLHVAHFNLKRSTPKDMTAPAPHACGKCQQPRACDADGLPRGRSEVEVSALGPASTPRHAQLWVLGRCKRRPSP